MKHKIEASLYWFFAVFPFLLSAAFYSRVPDRIAVHWDASGTANGYGSKGFGLFAVPAILLGTAVLVNVMLKIDPRSGNIDRSPQMKRAARWFIVILANAMDLFIILNALGIRFNMSLAVMTLVGIGIAVIGNYLPKCKFNYTMGIRVPWTLASEENWRKTHRMAGPFWVLGGVLIVFSGIFGLPWLMIAALVLLTAVPIGYSYVIFRKESRREMGEKSADDFYCAVGNRCFYCGKGCGADLPGEEGRELHFYCNESCRSKADQFLNHARHFTTLFLVLIGLDMAVLVFGSVFAPHLTVGPSMMFLGLLVVVFPFCTPQTFAILGIRKTIWIGRAAGLVTILLGLWIQFSM